jgi:glucokinase
MTTLLADVGGTNTRCAILHRNDTPNRIQEYANREHNGLSELLENYVESLSAQERPTAGLLAVAAPIRGELVRMININWEFSGAALKESLGFTSLTLLNDFEALALALPHLGDEDLRKIGAGSVNPAMPKVVLGPGTGLGVAGLIRANENWCPVSGEGGHVTLPATDQAEAVIIAAVREKFGHCSAERLISGSGLSLLHSTLHGADSIPPEIIGQMAGSGDESASESLAVFFRLLGTVAANAALTFGAFGGVYIGGGIVPQHVDAFIASEFRKRFEAKGRYGNYLKSIATFLIVADNPTLTGLAARARDSA